MTRTYRQGYPSGPWELIAEHGEDADHAAYMAGVIGPILEIESLTRRELRPGVVTYRVERLNDRRWYRYKVELDER